RTEADGRDVVAITHILKCGAVAETIAKLPDLAVGKEVSEGQPQIVLPVIPRAKGVTQDESPGVIKLAAVLVAEGERVASGRPEVETPGVIGARLLGRDA